LDTGATISTVVQSYYLKYFSNLPIVPLDSALNVEVAGGHSLPYLGYIQVTIVPDILDMTTPLTCLLLVVEDTDYGKQVPVIIGTNILSSLNHMRGKRRIPSIWHMAFRTMSLNARRLRHNQGRIALLQCAQPTTIPANRVASVECNANTEAYFRGTVLVESSSSCKLPAGVEVLPMI